MGAIPVGRSNLSGTECCARDDL